MTTLLTALSDLDNLADAWREVRRKKSAPGVDGVTVEGFALKVEAHLKTLRRDLLRGAYRPLPLRGAYLPKASGGWRMIGVPAVRDRVAQRACLNVLTPLLEPELEECSYAYRTGRSIYDAIAQVEAWREKGNRVLLDADIENCFDSIDRDLLFDVLRQYVQEPEVLALVRLWLEAGVAWTTTEGEKGRGGEGEQIHSFSPSPLLPFSPSIIIPPLGIPQGNIISPLLCNVFLDEFDEALLRRRFKLARYADDIVVVTASRRRAEKALEASEEALAELGLRLNRQKTRIVTFEQGFKYLGTIFAGDLTLPTVRQERVTASGERDILFVPGYPSPPKRGGERPQGARLPLPPSPSGIVAVSSQVAVARARGKLATPMGEALQRALEEKRRKERRRAKKEAEKPWETTFLV